MATGLVLSVFRAKKSVINCFVGCPECLFVLLFFFDTFPLFFGLLLTAHSKTLEYFIVFW